MACRVAAWAWAYKVVAWAFEAYIGVVVVVEAWELEQDKEQVYIVVDLEQELELDMVVELEQDMAEEQVQVCTEERREM